MARTTIDQKIAKLEAELKNAKASKSKEARQERNNQLMAIGIMLEMKYKSLSELERKKIQGWTDGLDERNTSRVKACFARLESGITREEISSEPPSQGSGIVESK